MKALQKSRVALLILGLIAIVTGCFAKLFVIGWEDGAAWADGRVVIRVTNEDDAQRLALVDGMISSPSTEDIHVTNGVVLALPSDEGVRTRLCLNGRGVRARARVATDPLRVVYDAPDEDAMVAEQIVELARRHGVTGKIEIMEISTPLNALTEP